MAKRNFDFDESDETLADRLMAHLRAKRGSKQHRSGVVKEALRALAEKEGLDDRIRAANPEPGGL